MSAALVLSVPVLPAPRWRARLRGLWHALMCGDSALVYVKDGRVLRVRCTRCLWESGGVETGR